LSKEGLDLRWAKGLDGIDCLVKTEGGKARRIPFLFCSGGSRAEELREAFWIVERLV
jgi:hypothetical protein